MIIYRGWGLAAFGIIFGCSAIAQLITNSLTGSGKYWTQNGWPLACALLSAGAGIMWLHLFLSNRPPRILVDEKTGERVAVNVIHHLFFIPLRFWSLICLGLAIFILMSGFAPGEYRSGR